MSIKNSSAIHQAIRAILPAILILSLLSSCKKEVFDPSLTKEFAIVSASNGASYTIKVGLPLDYNPELEKYAAIYVLDGEENFAFVSNQCAEMSAQFAVKNALVVSIGYGKDRGIDYTPTKVSSVTGGGPEFLQFIEKQLIPAIEQRFSVDTTRSGRVLLGHSYGGLFVGNAFCTNNKLFGNYIMLSPSFWFDDLVSLQYEKDNRELNKDKAQLVFMGIGGAENAGRMQAPFEAFYEALRDNYTTTKLAKNVEENLDHRGSENPNIVKGLEFYFQNR